MKGAGLCGERRRTAVLTSSLRRAAGSSYRMRPTRRVDYQKLLTENLGLLRQVVRGIARHQRLRDEDAEDLFGAVQLKLVEDDYAALRRFEGNAQLRTYFAAIAAHHLKDEQDRRLGKWRPSVFAQRAGPVAELLERLLTRDSCTFDEAVRILKTNYQVPESEADLYRLSLGFPSRQPRRFVDVGALETKVAPAGAPDALDGPRRAQLASRTASALRVACDRLIPQDRLLLRLFFQKGLPLSKIAKLLQVEAKSIYRRKDQVLAVLRDELQAQGITSDQIRDILPEGFEFDLIGDNEDDGNPGRVSV